MTDTPEFAVRTLDYSYGVWYPYRDVWSAEDAFIRLFEEQYGVKPPIRFNIKEQLEEYKYVWKEEKVKNSRWKRFLTGEEYHIVLIKVIYEKWSYITRGSVRVVVPPTNINVTWRSG